MQPQGLQVHWVIPAYKAGAVHTMWVPHVCVDLTGSGAHQGSAQGKHLLHCM